MMGSVLVQPQRVRRSRNERLLDSLLTDFANLVARLATDAETGGRIGEIARLTLQEAAERIARERLAGFAAAGPRVLQRLLGLVHALTGVSAAVRIAQPSDAILIAKQVLEHVANTLDGISAAEIRPHVATFLDILEHDLGFSFAAAEAELFTIVDAVATRLETEPVEGDLRARENRLETACLLRRIVRVVQAETALPAFNADRLAARIAGLLKNARAPEFAKQLRCVASALEVAATTGMAIEQLVPLAFGEFRTIGAAAAAAATRARYCWYASWLLNDDVVINKERTEIRRGATVVARGTDLGLLDIPEFKEGNNPFYRFGSTLDAEVLDTIALASSAGADALIFVLHLASSERGDVFSNLFGIIQGFTMGGLKVTLGRPPVGYILEDWVIPLPLAVLASLEGIHTKATGANMFAQWLTLLAPDVGEERLYRGYGRVVRNALLSTLTLINHKPRESPARGQPPAGVRADNFRELDGVADLVAFGAITIVSLIAVDREDWHLRDSAGDIRVGAIFKFFVLYPTLAALLGRFFGGMLSFTIAGDQAPVGSWFIRRPRDFFKLVYYWFWGVAFTYMVNEGNTDGGRYSPALSTLPYNGYPPRESSPYLLPYAGLCHVAQGNQGFSTHNDEGSFEVYSYDFQLDQDHQILCSRRGTVVDWFDWAPDDQNVGTAWPAATDTVLNPDALVPDPQQTQSSNANFILVRHDRDDAGALQNAGVFDAVHDRGAGNAAVRTYALYLHGRNGSVREAFASRSILPPAIIGTVVVPGDWIMRCGDTGNSDHNHLHMAVNVGPDTPDPATPGSGDLPPVAKRLLGLEVPFVFNDVDGDGVPTRLNWYLSKNVKTP